MVIAFKEHVYYTPQSFPVGGERFNLSNGKSLYLMPDGSTMAEAEDGTVWEYRGISAYKADNRDRIKGWQRV